MNFDAGDRIRWAATGEDGLPLVRYGFVGGQGRHDGPVVVILDGEIKPQVVQDHELQIVTIGNLELILPGADLISDPELRQGLLSLWQAEADTAGLAVEHVHPISECRCGGMPLAELHSCGERYVLHAIQVEGEDDIVHLRAVLHRE